MKRDDLLSSCVLFLFGAVTTILSLQMSIGTFREPGSGLFPFCLGILLVLLSAASFIKVLWSAQGEREKASDAAGEPESLLSVVSVLATMALATLLLNTLGYAIVSFVLMVGLLRILGSKRWMVNLTLSLLTAVGSHTVFVYLLKIPLPKGVLGI